MEAVISLSSSRVSGAPLKSPHVLLFLIYYFILEVTNTLEKTRDYYLAEHCLSVCGLWARKRGGALIKPRR